MKANRLLEEVTEFELCQLQKGPCTEDPQKHK